MIAINFLESTIRPFRFLVYRSIKPLGQSSAAPEGCAVFRLPHDLDGDADEENRWPAWAISHKPLEDFEQVSVSSDCNAFLTVRSIEHYLSQHVSSVEGLELSSKNDSMRRNRIYFDAERLTAGVRQVWLEPHFLRRVDNFGLICGFHFQLHENEDHSIEAQKGSFSLNQSSKANRAKLVDTAEFLGHFINENLNLFRDVEVGGNKKLSFGPKFSILEPLSLPTPIFVAGNGQEGNSTFALVNRAGPAKVVEKQPLFCFCFAEENREISRRVYRGLRGELSGGFKGLETTYGLNFSADNVTSASVPNWDDSELSAVVQKTREAALERLPFTIVVLPKEADEDDQIYWKIKARFLRAGVHSQLIRRATIVNPRTLEFSLPNLALNIFAKCGGSPWLSKTAGDEALVVGVSQSLLKNKAGEVTRVFGYAVVTDTSGAFRGMRFLADSAKSDEYTNVLQKNLESLIQESNQRYRRCVIHASFALRRAEISTIQDLARRTISKEFEVTVVQLSDTTKWIGFNKLNPMLVPDNGTVVQLSRNEAIAWLVSTAQGINSGRPNRPLYAKQLFPRESDVLTRCLREASGLSGLSWRNFGHTSLPVSILYAERVARALRECPELHEILASSDFDWPWFI